MKTPIPNIFAVYFNLTAASIGFILLLTAIVALHRYMWLPVMILWEAVLFILAATIFSSVSVLFGSQGLGRTVFAVGMLMLNVALIWLLYSAARMSRQRMNMHATLVSPYPDPPKYFETLE